MDIKNYLFTIEAIKQSRIKMLNIIESHSIEEINRIPEGFNNNLVWNFVHVVATHQLLCYSLSGVKTRIDSTIIDAYRKGSKPGDFVDAETLKVYSKLALETLEYFKTDLENNVFENFKPYPTSFGVSLDSFENAVHFNLAHETLHLGIMMGMQKAL